MAGWVRRLSRLESCRVDGVRRWAGLGPDGRPAVVECDHGSAQLVCVDCLGALRGVLADVPALLEDLDVSIRRQVRFVDHGTRFRVDDESPLPFDDRASRAKRSLVDAVEQLRVLAGGRGVLAELDRLAGVPGIWEAARDVAAAARSAHRAIDAPESDWYFGPCPDCSHDIYGQRADESDRSARVACEACSYSAHPIDLRQLQLDASEDRMLTVGELVGAITAAGEVVTRKQIDGWIRRGGLPRERHARPRWVGGELDVKHVYVYRLGDVRELARAAEERRSSH